MSWYIYLARCSDNSLYGGMTDDTDKRIKTHNSGKGAKYTRSRLPVSLVYREECESRSEALKRERQIKRLTHAQKEKLCENYIDLSRKSGYNDNNLIKGDEKMIYTIENDKIKASFSDVGAELVSLINKADGEEYLWQGDAAYWTGHAYNLFPICGRLTEGKYTYKGETYEMNLHGFARKTSIPVTKQEDKKITFTLTSNEDTLKIYPFKFKLDITYSLCRNALTTAFTLKNTDDKVMYFAFGTHPGFNVPLGGDGTFEDYYLEFDEEASPEKLCMSETCYYLGKNEKFEGIDGKVISLKHSLFDNDAVFLYNVPKAVTLKNKVSARSVRVEYPDMQYLGIWHAPKTEAPYVCIEPWYSIPADDGKIDDLETKREMMTLDPKGTYKTKLVFKIN